tara:strand:+ start:215 stop:1168 length:954 start_codon:yes stop_codon:yes gene_type:complete
MAKWIYIAFLLVNFSGFSQKLSSNASVKKILIGEPIMIKYRVVLDKNATIEFKEELNNILGNTAGKGTLTKQDAKFEITETFTDTTKFKNNDKEWIGRYTVTIWDSGTFILPAPHISIDDSSYKFQDIVIYANYTKQVKGLDIYDINESFAEIPAEPFSFSEFLVNNWWWLLIIVLIIPIYFLVKLGKRNEMPEPLFKAMSLKERTLLAIDALDNEKLWEKEKLKEHFVELSYILRSYLTARYSITLLEKTTYEAKLLLTQNGLNEDTVENIGRILSESDMVKFAKSKPEVISILRVSTLARQIVAETSPLDFDSVE